jgi:hypothetical protein
MKLARNGLRKTVGLRRPRLFRVRCYLTEFCHPSGNSRSKVNLPAKHQAPAKIKPHRSYRPKISASPFICLRLRQSTRNDVFLTEPARLYGVLYRQNPHCPFAYLTSPPFRPPLTLFLNRNSSAPAARTASPSCSCKTPLTPSRNAPPLSSTPSSLSETPPPPGSPNGSASAPTFQACMP